jgi:hypothetical protein
MAATLLAPAAPARAAQKKMPIQPLGITQFGGDLLINGNMQTQSQTAADKKVTTESESFFDETLSINSAGYIYHPNLLEWFGGIRGGFVQQSITVNDQTTVGPGQVKGYNISGTFLREKPVSVMLFSSDTRSFINRDFASSTDLKSTRNGGQVMLKGDVPMTLMFEKVTMDENSGLRTDQRTTRHIKYTASQERFKDAQIEFFYDHEETDEIVTFRPSQGGQQTKDQLPYIRDEADLMSLIKFGPAEYSSTLGLHGRTMQRLDTFPEHMRSGDLNLNLAHTKNFSTFYRASYSEDQTEVDQERNANGSVGFSQQVYDSLTITGHVDGQKFQFPDGMRTQKGEFLSLDYQKKTPIGRYSSSLMLGVQDTSEQTKNGEEAIRGESVTFIGFLTFVPLSGRNIVPGSIRVWNTTRTIEYQAGLGKDYDLQTIGATTSIEPLPGGLIGPAQKVLVDYIVTAAKSAAWRTDFSTWDNRLQLPEGIPITLYYNFNRQADHLTSGDDPGNLDIQTGRLGGAQFEQWGLTLTGEHETRDMKLSPPTTANRARVQYMAHIARDVDLSLGGSNEHLMYRNAQQFGMQPGRDRLYTLQGFARATFRLQRNLLFHMEAEYDKTQGLENRVLKHVGVGVEWSYRDLEINVEVKQSDYVQEKTSGQSQSLLFSVRRRF